MTAKSLASRAASRGTCSQPRPGEAPFRASGKQLPVGMSSLAATRRPGDPAFGAPEVAQVFGEKYRRWTARLRPGRTLLQVIVISRSSIRAQVSNTSVLLSLFVSRFSTPVGM